MRQRQFEDHVLFVGCLDRETELHDCYQAAILFVFASRTETRGLVLLEAMAEGVPVVLTAVMGTRDVLQDRAGCLIAPDEVRGFARRVLEALANPELYEQLVVAAKSYVEQWTASLFAQRLVTFYQQSGNGGIPGRRDQLRKLP